MQSNLGQPQALKYYFELKKYDEDMQCAVYDTYVTKKDGRTMHFDVIVEDSTAHNKAIEFGKEYMQSVGQGEQKMTLEECQFCHIQEAPGVVEITIREKGYYIQKMEGCP